jgi:hypothetical protein
MPRANRGNGSRRDTFGGDATRRGVATASSAASLKRAVPTGRTVLSGQAEGRGIIGDIVTTAIGVATGQIIGRVMSGLLPGPKKPALTGASNTEDLSEATLLATI